MPDETEESHMLEFDNLARHNMTVNDSFAMEMTCVEPTYHSVTAIEQNDQADQTVRLRSMADFFKSGLASNQM